MNCRFCNNTLKHEFIDLVNSPPSNSYLTKDQLNEPEIFYPLKLFICDKCFLLQIDEYKSSVFKKTLHLFYSSCGAKDSFLSGKMKFEVRWFLFFKIVDDGVRKVMNIDGNLIDICRPKKIKCVR